MKKWLFALLLLVSPASASWHSVLQVSVGPPPAYTGPGDVISGAVAWWGLRCYTSAYAGNVADVVDTSTGNTTGTRLQCASGTVSALVSGSACTFVTGNACSALATTCATACKVVTLYDQSGSNKCNSSASPCDVTNATNANRPDYITSCLGGLPCLRAATVAAKLTLASATSHAAVSQPFTFSSVSKRIASFTTYQVVCCDAAFQVAYAVTINNAVYVSGAGNTTQTASDSAAHNYQMVSNNAGTSYLTVDATQTSFALGNATAFASTTYRISGSTAAANNAAIDFFELGVWPSAFSTGNQTSMCHNQFAYWGTSTSC